MTQKQDAGHANKVVVYDPPSGWKYGFPKPYTPLEGERLEETLRRDGYPQIEINKLNGRIYCRFWESEDYGS